MARCQTETNPKLLYSFHKPILNMPVSDHGICSSHSSPGSRLELTRLCIALSYRERFQWVELLPIPRPPNVRQNTENREMQLRLWCFLSTSRSLTQFSGAASWKISVWGALVSPRRPGLSWALDRTILPLKSSAKVHGLQLGRTYTSVRRSHSRIDRDLRKQSVSVPDM